MTIYDRANAFIDAFPKNPASHPWLVREQGRDVLYAVWVIGNDYRNKSRYYGSYPPGFLQRVMALYPEVGDSVLHVFSGSLPAGHYTRLDIDPGVEPDVVGSVYDADELLQRTFRLIVADPPYSLADAQKYASKRAVNRGKATRALARVAAPGGHLAWLDTCWPIHSKKEWLTVGRILVQRSTNHRTRVLTLFERANAA